MSHNTEELIDFLGIVERKGLLKPNTAQGRRTACSKLFTVLEDDERTVEYVSGNLEIIRTKFQNLNKEVLGSTIDEYVRRVAIVVADFTKWTEDRAAWEREIAAKGTKANGEGNEKRERASKQKAVKVVAAATADNPEARTVKIQLRSGFEVSVTLPRQLTMADLRHIGWALTPYAEDWSERAPQQHGMFQPQLDDAGELRP